MFLSTPMYRVKPYFLILIGGISMFSIEHPAGVLAGLVLVGLGGLIIKMRKQNHRGLT